MPSLPMIMSIGLAGLTTGLTGLTDLLWGLAGLPGLTDQTRLDWQVTSLFKRSLVSDWGRNPYASSGKGPSDAVVSSRLGRRRW